ncbi:uncharacterized protein LOC125924222 [Panthera uncia]|uniref:uncharacterized protein LOC125924222 n=1 Tax=Panthera uncia TaxID=29064 RepID=UPI0020FFC602|nr:uncharacterized protein LOC125924222 [Panthera uncia]
MSRRKDTRYQQKGEFDLKATFSPWQEAFYTSCCSTVSLGLQAEASKCMIIEEGDVMTDLEGRKTEGKFHCGYGDGGDGGGGGEGGGRSDGADDRYEGARSSGGLGGEEDARGGRDSGGEDAGGSGGGGLSDDAGGDGGGSGNSRDGNSSFR